MRSARLPLSLAAALLLGCLPLPRASADDGKSAKGAKEKASTTAEQDVPTYGLLDAMGQGLVAVDAEGRGDGRMTVSVTNKTKHPLRVVLPPGIIAQGASGQMGGMGGMGGGGMGGGGGRKR